MSSAPPPKLEDALAELEVILHELEEGQIGLEESLGRYEQGVRILKQCFGLLENAERRIELCTGVDQEGNPITRPFREEAGAIDEPSPTGARRRAKPAGEKPARRRAAEKENLGPGDEADGDSSPPGLF